MNSNFRRSINLKHLLVEARKYIGLQYYPDKVVDALTQQLDGVQWHNEYRMHYVPNEITRT